MKTMRVENRAPGTICDTCHQPIRRGEWMEWDYEYRDREQMHMIVKGQRHMPGACPPVQKEKVQ